MRSVVLLYDRDCPNVRDARTNLVRAFVAAGISPRWSEVDRAAEDTPAEWRGYSSPTVLVDGRDVCGGTPGAGPGCRLRTASVEEVTAKLSPWETERTATSWRSLVAAAPGIGVALLPKLGCPACWPAYAGLLSAIGLGFLIETRYLLALTVAFLALTLAALGWRAERRRGWGPFALGVLAGALILGGKFALEIDPLMYLGVALLVGASLWNSWPRRAIAACPACEVTT